MAKTTFDIRSSNTSSFNRLNSIFQKNDDIKEASNASTPGTPKRSIGQAEIESSYYKYDGTFSDHLEMLVQMGYVVLFSAAFPLAGVCAIANNLLEIRSDAFKLVHVHQRPFGQRVANIGTWQTALSCLSLAAVIVNCALIGLSGQVQRLWPGITAAQTIILIVALEHIMLGLRQALTWILPELPSWLEAEIARAEHCRREMQCKGTTPSPPSTTSVSQINDDQGAISPDQPLNEHLDDEIIFHHISPNSPKIKLFGERDSRETLETNIEADVCIKEAINKEITPDSPITQVCHIYQFNFCARWFFIFHSSEFSNITSYGLHSQQQIPGFRCTIYNWKYHRILGKSVINTKY